MSIKEFNVVGKPVRLRDLETHVNGQTEYYEDHHYKRMLHLKMHRSAYGHAIIKSVDTRDAAQSPGVVAVLTHEDLPGKKLWNPMSALGVLEDEPVLAFDKVQIGRAHV